jgi:hypothetical protein
VSVSLSCVCLCGRVGVLHVLNYIYIYIYMYIYIYIYIYIGGGHSAPNHPVMLLRQVYRWDCIGQFFGGNSGAQPFPQVPHLVHKVAGPGGRYNDHGITTKMLQKPFTVTAETLSKFFL